MYLRITNQVPFIRVALVALTVLIAAAACGGGEQNAFRVEGRNLEIIFEAPIVGKRVYFTNNGKDWVIEVADPSTRIAAVNVTVVNRRINITKLTVDSDSVAIGNGKAGQRIQALAPSGNAVPFTGTMPKEETFTPLLWQDFQLELGFQAAGWIFFEVPVGIDLDTLWWSAADDIIGRY
jgi:hypothetical protein